MKIDEWSGKSGKASARHSLGVGLAMDFNRTAFGHRFAFIQPSTRPPLHWMRTTVAAGGSGQNPVRHFPEATA